MKEELKIAVFASGKGSNFRAVLEAIEKGNIKNANIVCLISNNSDSGALVFAKEKNIPAYHISKKQFSTEKEFNENLLASLEKHNVNFILLAGYMKLLDSSIVRKFKNKIINIHPALLPKYGGKGMYGMCVHEAVIASGEKISGATVHIVDEEYDRGPIVLQKTVQVMESDTPETLAARILEIEHEIYPEAVSLFASGKVQIKEEKTIILEDEK